MKTIQKNQLLVFFLFYCNFSHALNITIIESQSNNSTQIMDTTWSTVVLAMGHNPSISPQSTLDNNTFFSTTDILIISSGVIDLPANRVNTILQFIQSGKPVYLQSEYLPTYSTNQAFSYLVAQFGGTFSWNNGFTGNISPMNVLGYFANTNNNIVTPLSYYWYSVSGIGDCNTVNFLESGNEYHGFHYIPSNSLFGTIITCTDQDWIRVNLSPQLMENIITQLITPGQLTNVNLDLGNDTTLCQGQTLTLNGGLATSYLWSNGSTASSINASTSGTYWVQVSNG